MQTDAVASPSQSIAMQYRKDKGSLSFQAASGGEVEVKLSADSQRAIDSALLNPVSFQGEDFDLSELPRPLDLSDRVFQNLSFSNANLQGANLENASFDNCDLTGANLFQADLKDTKFGNCRLERAWFGANGLPGQEHTIKELFDPKYNNDFGEQGIILGAKREHLNRQQYDDKRRRPGQLAEFIQSTTVHSKDSKDSKD